MTVQELITELTQFEPDLEVRVRITNSAQSHTLRGAPVRISGRTGMFAEIPVDPDDYIELFSQKSFGSRR